MKKLILVGAVCAFVAGCAIEGVGFDGRRDALRNADRDGQDYVVLHSGARDSTWYAGWCNAVLPHFERMSEQKDRVIRYCGAMQAQPENAAAIQDALSRNLAAAVPQADADSAHNSAVAAAFLQQQAKQRVACTSTAIGNTVNTNCY